jgi:hypothetical protein
VTLSSAVYFIDANVPMYAAGSEHPLKEPCLGILRAVAKHELSATTDVEVLQEILHRYSAMGERGRAREIVELFMTVVPDVLAVTAADFVLALKLHADYPVLQARDSLHAATMQNHDIRHIVSADRHFDAVPTLSRVDPLFWVPAS